MTTPTQTPALDPTVAEQLSRRFADVFTTFDAGDDLFASDAFFDLNMPVWRFQLEGSDAFAAQLEGINAGPSRVELTHTVPTISGFVAEHVEHQSTEEGEIMARRMWLCEVRDGLIVEAIGYCSGEWDEALRARHSLEAPMIRP